MLKFKQTLGFFLSLILFISPVSYPTVSNTDSLAPSKFNPNPLLLEELEKAKMLSSLFTRLDLNPIKTKDSAGKEHQLKFETGQIIEACQNSDGKHFPFILAVIDQVSRDNPILLYKAGKELLNKAKDPQNDITEEDRELCRKYASLFFGAALYLSRDETQKETMFTDVVEQIKSHPEMIPTNEIDPDGEGEEKKPYSAAEYAAILETLMIPMIGLQKVNGNLKRWNEKSWAPSQLPNLLEELEEGSRPKEEVLEAIKKEYDNQDQQFGEITRGSQLDVDQRSSAETVVYPKRGEMTAIPLNEGKDGEARNERADPQKTIDDIFEILLSNPKFQEESVRELLEAKKKEITDSLQIIPAAEEGQDRQLILSREHLDDIGCAMLLAGQLGSLNNFWGKGDSICCQSLSRWKERFHCAWQRELCFVFLGRKVYFGIGCRCSSKF